MKKFSDGDVISVVRDGVGGRLHMRLRDFGIEDSDLAGPGLGVSGLF